MRWLMEWSSRHPRTAIAAVLFISLVALWPAGRLRLEASVKSLMVRNDPARAFYQQTRDLFGSEAVSIVCVEDPHLFSPHKLTALQQLLFDLEDLDGVAVSESLFSVTSMDMQHETLDVRPLIDWPPDTQEEADRMRQRARSHSAIRRVLLSDDATVTSIQLRFRPPDSGGPSASVIRENIDACIAARAGDFLRVEQLGRSYVIDMQKQYILRDQRVVLPLAVLMMVVTLSCMLGRVARALLPLLTAGVSVLWTLGFMGLCDLPITCLTFMVPALILVIGSTEDVHLLAEYRSGRHDGLAAGPAVRRMIRRIGVAVVFTALTTFAGFATIVAAPMPLLNEFGMAASFGMLANPLVTIILVPACLSLSRSRAPAEHGRGRAGRIETVILGFLARLRRRPALTLVCICLPCLLAGLFGAAFVRADNNIIGYFRDDSDVVQRLDRFEEHLCGSETFCIRFDADGARSLKDPEFLRYIFDLQRRLEGSGWIDRTAGITDYLSYIHQAITGCGEPLPAEAGSVAEYLLMLHHSEIEPYMTSDGRHLCVIVHHSERSSRRLVPRIQALQNELDETCPEGMSAEVTGEMLLVNKAVDSIVLGQLRGIGVIALVAALLMSLLFRSLRIGFLALIPNLLPIGVQFGVMALFRIPLNTATSMAAAIGIGLAVDDTIHLLIRFYAERGDTDHTDVVARAVRHVLRPVIATSLSLIFGLLTLRYSSFVPIADFGFLAALVLLAALASDLMVTPTLLSLSCMHPARRRPRSINE